MYPELSSDILEKLKLYFYKNYKGVSQLSVDKYVKDTLSMNRADEELRLLEKKLNFSLGNHKLLEIGSGFGMFVINSIINHRILTCGVEPDLICYQTSKELLSIFGISPEVVSNNAGENLPFASNYFDIVYSSNVLEHVNDPEKVFFESIRVIKPGGYLFFVIPNYASWWDGHYGIIWLPNMSKHIAKCYVKILGRDPKFLDTLQLITLKKVEHIVQKFNDQLEILNWGWDVWSERLITLDFSGWADLNKLKKILQVIKKLRLLKSLVYFGKRSNWLTPILLLGRKKRVEN